ncbi:hypothetical protein ACP70R_000483 [Stipagrostis hirtigluma subsp. patula]
MLGASAPAPAAGDVRQSHPPRCRTEDGRLRRRARRIRGNRSLPPSPPRASHPRQALPAASAAACAASEAGVLLPIAMLSPSSL